ncbi:MAG: hypothetical protein VSS75_017120 [Candidatus Parabeggiatoa sp.]|nr:hypothetical protein [Candidatus Parabeggiatoa sp.]
MKILTIFFFFCTFLMNLSVLSANEGGVTISHEITAQVSYKVVNVDDDYCLEVMAQKRRNLSADTLAAASDPIEWTINLHKSRLGNFGVEATQGAWVKLSGDVELKCRLLESSEKYRSLKSQYGFEAGSKGFFEWLRSTEAEDERKKVIETFQELLDNRKEPVDVKIDLEVTGVDLYTPSHARAHIFVIGIEKKGERKVYVISSEDIPQDDIGADDNGNILPDNNNKSMVTPQSSSDRW